MSFPEQLFCAILGVGCHAKRHKTAALWLVLWSMSHKCLLISGSRMNGQPCGSLAIVLSARSTNMRVAIAELAEPVAEACWRLIGLLEYLASLLNDRQ